MELGYEHSSMTFSQDYFFNVGLLNLKFLISSAILIISSFFNLVVLTLLPSSKNLWIPSAVTSF